MMLVEVVHEARADGRVLILLFPPKEMDPRIDDEIREPILPIQYREVLLSEGFTMEVDR